MHNKRNYAQGNILNIKIHYTWILIFILVTSIVTTQFTEDYPLWQRIVLGVVVCVCFLAAVIVRELIIRAAAFHKEKPRRKITIFAFGGVYRESKNNLAAVHQPLLYLAKYLSNLIIAVIFYALFATFISTNNLLMAGLAQWLAYIYFLLFLLHFIPAFPLDGGQILRTVLRRSSGDYYKATSTASTIGRGTGLFMIFAGVLVFIITMQWNISLIIVLLGWIIQIAANNTRRQVRTHMALQNGPGSRRYDKRLS
jgi:Zn-dependent protease